MNPIVSLIIFGIEYLGKKYSADSFLNQILPNKINISEQILCLALFLTSIVSYLRIFNFKCKRWYNNISLWFLYEYLTLDYIINK